MLGPVSFTLLCFVMHVQDNQNEMERASRKRRQQHEKNRKKFDEHIRKMRETDDRFADLQQVSAVSAAPSASAQLSSQSASAAKSKIGIRRQQTKETEALLTGRWTGPPPLQTCRHAWDSESSPLTEFQQHLELDGPSADATCVSPKSQKADQQTQLSMDSSGLNGTSAAVKLSNQSPTVKKLKNRSRILRQHTQDTQVVLTGRLNGGQVQGVPETKSAEVPSAKDKPQQASQSDCHSTQTANSQEAAQAAISVEAPHASTSVEAPQATTSVEAPQTTTSVEAPQATTSVEAPQTTTSVEAPQTTTSVEAPQATTSVEVPQATTSIEAPQATTSAEAPQAATAVEAPQAAESLVLIVEEVDAEDATDMHGPQETVKPSLEPQDMVEVTT